MADYRKLIPFILRWEGGFAHDPDDLGGPTNKGVTLDTYKAYCRRKGYPVPTVARLKALTEEQWEDIFKTMFWDRWQADRINSQAVANILVDWVWASGSYGIKIPQSVLGVTVDGIVGDKTIKVVNAQNPSVLFARIKKERLAFVERICRTRPQNRKFRHGWINRINAINGN